jgi:hypothetical protein
MPKLLSFGIFISLFFAFGLSDFRTFRLFLQQIKPNIFPEIHPVVINTCGISGSLL